MARRRCHYCNKAPGKTKDHIVPRALGGPNAKWNYVEACTGCNADKGHDWPTCPCGICQLAITMFLWAKERGLPATWPPDTFETAHQGRAREALLRRCLERHRTALWAERVVRMERWEDAPWIGKVSHQYDALTGKVKVSYTEPDPFVGNRLKPTARL